MSCHTQLDLNDATQLILLHRRINHYCQERSEVPGHSFCVWAATYPTAGGFSFSGGPRARSIGFPAQLSDVLEKEALD